MAKYFRKRSTSRIRRRYFKTTRLIRRLPRIGTRRFYKRQRRNAKPEIKRAQTSIPLTTILNNAPNLTINLMPVSWTQGDAWGQRQGRVIKTRKIVLTLRFTPVIPTSGTIRPDNLLKYIIWAPRRNYTTVQEQMDVIGPTAVPAYTDCSVYKHGYIRVGAPVSGLTTTYPSDQYKEFVINAPRTLEFGDSTDSTIDPNQTVNITFINASDISIRTSGAGYVYYIDP